VLDARPLGGLGRSSLCLRGRGHEGDQRFENCLLHRRSKPSKVKLLITGYHYGNTTALTGTPLALSCC
jgi:hypothetical protein